MYMYSILFYGTILRRSLRILFLNLRGISHGHHTDEPKTDVCKVYRFSFDNSPNSNTLMSNASFLAVFGVETSIAALIRSPWPWTVWFGENWNVHRTIYNWRQRWPVARVSGTNHFDTNNKTVATVGNNFRWKQAPMEQEDFDGDSYIGVMANCVWHLRQGSDHLLYRILGELNEKTTNELRKVRHKVVPTNRRKKSNGLLFDDKYYEGLLKTYFRMDTNLAECYQMWSAAHTHFAQEASQFYAIRVLDQDPVENLFSFICSQNNHISRWD